MKPLTTPPDNARLLTLDAMRGLAALAVVLWHFEFMGPFAKSGYLAVDFFFLMSGIVIARAYSARLAAGLTLGDFLIERLIRLYPLYILGFVIGVVRLAGQIVAHHPNRMTWPELGVSAVFNLFMLPSPATSILAPINIPAWSLFFELLVNLVWAAVLVKASRRTLTAYVALLAVGLCIAVVADGSAEGGWIWSDLHMGLLRSFFGFGLGVLLARRVAQGAPRASALSLVAALALCTLLLVGVAPAYRATYDLVAILLCFPLIACAGVAFDPPAVLRRAAHALGDVSYPVYVLHFAPTFTLSYVARKLDISPFIWMPVFIVTLFAVSLYLARTYDPAARRYLRNALLAPRPKAASAT